MVIALDNEIVGRDGELAGLASFLEADGPGRALVIEGEAEPNLTRVYEKLEVRSRAELAARSPGRVS
ncbi:MAG TPA: hypothetical protein VML35_04255 [Gaiellaceae bacterium]|nr:hypothetical protein [Gaiellaceae bacterium]